jgi:hypothetical protein
MGWASLERLKILTDREIIIKHRGIIIKHREVIIKHRGIIIKYNSPMSCMYDKELDTENTLKL